MNKINHTTSDSEFGTEETSEQKISEVKTDSEQSIHDGHVEEASIISILESMYKIFAPTEQNRKKDIFGVCESSVKTNEFDSISGDLGDFNERSNGMNELTIKKHSFEEAKNRLKKFSTIENTELSIENVETTGGLFGWFDHKVTGEELNDRMVKIQDFFINLNSTDNKIIKEFHEIYKALDVLDREYIASIIAIVKGLEKTSNDVRKHNELLQEQQNKLNTHQNEIDGIVENHKETIEVLKRFKERLEASTKEIDRELDETVQQLPPNLKKSLSKLFAKYHAKNDATLEKIQRKMRSIKPASKFPIVAGIIAIILGAGAFVSVFLPLKAYIDAKENKQLIVLNDKFQNKLKSLDSTFETKFDSMHTTIIQTDEAINAMHTDVGNLQESYNAIVNTINEQASHFTKNLTFLQNKLSAKEEALTSVQKELEALKSEYQILLTLNEQRIASLEKEQPSLRLLFEKNTEYISQKTSRAEDIENLASVPAEKALQVAQPADFTQTSLEQDTADDRMFSSNANGEISQRSDDAKSMAMNDNTKVQSFVPAENSKKGKGYIIKRILFFIVGILIGAIILIGGIILFLIKKS